MTGVPNTYHSGEKQWSIHQKPVPGSVKQRAEQALRNECAGLGDRIGVRYIHNRLAMMHKGDTYLESMEERKQREKPVKYGPDWTGDGDGHWEIKWMKNQVE